ncbi:MgtC/SapB family protein [Actinomadura harenae]|uniref:MgtC/SapB family protein n=1 Tax=Actinomadura harenae TaxID=2483351 RepID=A0A3M2LQC3_9ACTN|nr:MgtC/SapB family protein [Actinomadura harenae]RMI39684.1 MgtC/SapB family protein [Actinomadura harenae]
MQGQGWVQLGELLLAMVLSAAIGVERGLRNKSAGVRTHTLVGVGAALFMLVSKYGFQHVPGPHVSFDPSRVAAQIVSGIGFIGGGLIFVRRDAVRGLTTAAVVWVTAAVGMAAGGGLWLLAVAVTAAHFAVVLGLNTVVRWLPLQRFVRHPGRVRLRLVYKDGRGVLRRALMECTGRGFVVEEAAVDREYLDDDDGAGGGRDERLGRDEAEHPRTAAVTLVLDGPGDVHDLTAALSEQPGVISVTSGGEHDDHD